jgi:hypothetical protein
LCKSHPDLGRDGPVCPFAQPSISKGLFWLTIVDFDREHHSQMASVVEQYRDWFLELAPQSGPESLYKTILGHLEKYPPMV